MTMWPWLSQTDPGAPAPPQTRTLPSSRSSASPRSDASSSSALFARLAGDLLQRAQAALQASSETQRQPSRGAAQGKKEGEGNDVATGISAPSTASVAAKGDPGEIAMWGAYAMREHGANSVGDEAASALLTGTGYSPEQLHLRGDQSGAILRKTQGLLSGCAVPLVEDEAAELIARSRARRHGSSTVPRSSTQEWRRLSFSSDSSVE